MLVVVSSANAAPQGTVIKEGILTYPAGPYLTEDPLLLSLGNYTGDNSTQTSPESFQITCSEKEFLFFNDSRHNIAPGNLNAWNLWTYLSSPYCPFPNIFIIKSSRGVLHSGSLFPAISFYLTRNL